VSSLSDGSEKATKRTSQAKPKYKACQLDDESHACEVHFALSLFRNVCSLSKSEKGPLVRQNCAVTLQEKKIEI
jgi:hypothetical protein